MKVITSAFVIVFFAVAARAGAEEQTVWAQVIAGKDVSVVKSWISSPLEGRFSVFVRGQQTGLLKVPIDLAAGSLDAAQVWNGKRLVVVVGGLVSVVDLDLMTVQDQFVIARWALSPDGRFVAFTRAIPRDQDRLEDVVLLYDVASGPALNRMRAGETGLAHLQDTGIAAFPEELRANKQYRSSAGSKGPVSLLRSPIMWCDARSFVFLDLERKPGDRTGVNLVRIIVQGDAGNVRFERTALDAASIANTETYEVKTDPSEVIVAKQIIVLRQSANVCRIRVVLDAIPGRLGDYFDIDAP